MLTAKGAVGLAPQFGVTTLKLVKKDVGDRRNDRTFVLSDAKFFEKREMDFDHHVDTWKDALDDVR